MPLARRLFEPPTFNYKTGSSSSPGSTATRSTSGCSAASRRARSVEHLADVFVLAGRAGTAARPGAGRRPQRTPRCGSRDRPGAGSSLNLMTVDHWSLAEAAERCAARRDRVGGAVAAPAHAGRAARAARRRSARLAVPRRVLHVTGRRRRQPPGGRAGGRARRAGARARLRAAGRRRAAGRARHHRRGHRAPAAVRRRPRRPARDRAAAPDDGRRALGDRHARRGARRSRAVDAGVGVVVDAYHVFWDPRLEAELAGAHGLHRRLPRVRLARPDTPTCWPAAG